MNDNINPAYVLLGAVLLLAVLGILYFLQKKSKPAPADDDTPRPSRPVSTVPVPAPAPPAKRFDPNCVVSPVRSSLLGRITGFDTAPDELNLQVPFNLRFIRPMPADDGSNYVLAALHKPLTFRGASVHYLVVGARFDGTQIGRGMRDFPVNIAIVKDESLVEDARLDFAKAEYVAIGFCDEIPKEEIG